MTKKVDCIIISAKDFIKAKPNAEFDLQQSKKTIIDLVSIAESPALAWLL